MRLNPVWWLDEKVFTPSASWVVERQRIGVTEGPEGLRKVYKWMIVRLVAALALIFLYDSVPEPWDSFTNVAVGGWLGYSAMSGYSRASAYRQGWLDGRRRMANNLQQHVTGERSATGGVGVDATNWLDAEYNHDVVHVLGLPPTQPPQS